MKLTVHDRLMLGNILPQEGSFATLKLLRNLKMDLSFSEEETKKWSIQATDGRVDWRLFDTKNKPIDQDAEIKIGPKAKDIIVLALSKLNDEKKLRDEHYALYERFIGE